MAIEKLETEVPVLQTNRLTLRGLSVNDANDVFEYASDPEITKYVIWEAHQNLNDSIQFINLTKDLLSKSQFIWGIELSSIQKIIGTISTVKVDVPNLCCEVGYALSKNYSGKGIATEALKAVINFCFQNLNMNRVEAHCEHENIASWKVMEKCSMKYEGTLRERVLLKEKYRSMKMYSILRSEWVELRNTDG